MDNIEEIKRSLQNAALTPAYRQVLEDRVRELESRAGRPSESAPANPAQSSVKYRGVANMSLDEIISFFSQRGFYRLDTPIKGLEALQTRYKLAAVLGYDRAAVERIAAAVERLGGELPPMETIKVDDLLKRE